MKKKALITLNILIAASMLGLVGYIGLAAGSEEPGPTTTATGTTTIKEGETVMIEEGGTNVTVQGVPTEDGACFYAFSAIAPGGSGAIDITHKERRDQYGMHSSGSMGPIGPGESGFSVGAISQDQSTCTAVFELRPSGTDRERMGVVPPFPGGPTDLPYTGTYTTIQGTPNEKGGCEYSGSGSPRIISEDRSTCTAVIELGAPEGSWASSTEIAAPPPPSP